jgi:hypothetical protein
MTLHRFKQCYLFHLVCTTILSNKEVDLRSDLVIYFSAELSHVMTGIGSDFKLKR